MLTCAFVAGGFAVSNAVGDDVRPVATVILSPNATVVTRPTEGQRAGEVTGKIVVDDKDRGLLLLEDAARRIHTLKPGDVDKRADSDRPWRYLSDEELAEELLANAGANFAIHQTEHFLVCSDASEIYTSFCGKLLEKVFAEYLDFFKDSELSVKPPGFRLPVLVFRDVSRFRAYARQQHPETDFTDVPGYYSIRDNQVLITALSGDQSLRTNSELLRELRKNMRQVETIVHEAVHQLTYNTGLMVRYADTPLWLSEGLAVYFEPASGRSSTIWNRPGEVSSIHFPTLRDRIQNGSGFGLPFKSLLENDSAFLTSETLADAYGQAWALTYFLVRTNRKGLDQLLIQVGGQAPMKRLSPEERLNNFVQSTNSTLESSETDLLRFVARIRGKP